MHFDQAKLHKNSTSIILTSNLVKKEMETRSEIDEPWSYSSSRCVTVEKSVSFDDGRQIGRFDEFDCTTMRTERRI